MFMADAATQEPVGKALTKGQYFRTQVEVEGLSIRLAVASNTVDQMVKEEDDAQEKVLALEAKILALEAKYNTHLDAVWMYFQTALVATKNKTLKAILRDADGFESLVLCGHKGRKQENTM